MQSKGMNQNLGRLQCLRTGTRGAAGWRCGFEPYLCWALLTPAPPSPHVVLDLGLATTKPFTRSAVCLMRSKLRQLFYLIVLFCVLLFLLTVTRPSTHHNQRKPLSETSSSKVVKMGFTKELLKAGNGIKPKKGQSVTVHCTGYGKNRDLSQKFWSTKDPGQQPFTFNVGMGSGT
eukprot:scaffold36136_cov145-Amphora_coffeaeformis.AAC.1